MVTVPRPLLDNVAASRQTSGGLLACPFKGIAMSAVRIACSGCGVRLTLKNQDKLGKKIKCPKCGGVFVARPVEEQQPVPDDDDGWLSDLGDVGMGDPDLGRDPRTKQRASGDSRKSSKSKSSGKKRAAATKRGPDSQRKLLFAGIGGGAVVVALAIWAIVAFTGNKNDDKPNNDNVVQNDGTKTEGPGTPNPDGNQPGKKQNGNSVPPNKKTPAGPDPNKTTNGNGTGNGNKTPPAKKPRTQQTVQQARANLDAVVREIRNARNLDDQQRAGLIQRTATAVKKTQDLLAKKQPHETDFIPPLYSCATMLRNAQGQANDVPIARHNAAIPAIDPPVSPMPEASHPSGTPKSHQVSEASQSGQNKVAEAIPPFGLLLLAVVYSPASVP